MKNQNLNTKPIMQTLLGIGCLAICYATIVPLRIVENYKYNSNKYSPEDELFFFSFYWISLIAGVVLIIIGILGVIKLFVQK